jgi:beta propeller repeat protein
MKIWFFRAPTSNSKFLLIIIGLWATLLVITALPGAALAQGPIEVLEEFLISYTDSPVLPAVSGDIVVFHTRWPSDIYGYDLSTHTEFSITHHGSSALPDISDDTIVWQDYRNGNLDIYGYDLGEDREFQITNNTAKQACPAINGNTVVWLDWRNGGDTYGDDIYGYDINTGTEFRITDPATTGIGCPDISGNTVVWSDSRSGTWNVYAYNLASNTEVQITDGVGSTTPFYSAISGNVIVVGGEAIYGFDLSGNPLFEVLACGECIVGPVDIDGNLVVWQQEPWISIGPKPYIVGYDITSGHRFWFSGSEYEAWYPKISGDVVVWHGCRYFGPSFCYPWGVYASRLLESVQLSVSSQFVDPGDVLTYTIALAEVTTTSHKSITDSLSSFATLDVPSLSATSGNYGYHPATHVITWTGDVSSSNPVTITYNATVSLDASLGEHLTNTVIISDQTSIFTRTASTWVARRTYLPLIMHSVNP